MKPENVLMGKRIAAARQDRGWSKADLARRAGIHPSYVTRIEQGRFDRPSIDLVGAIARTLGVSVADLMGQEPDPATVSALRAELESIFGPEDAPTAEAALDVLSRRTAGERRAALRILKALTDTENE